MLGKHLIYKNDWTPVILLCRILLFLLLWWEGIKDRNGVRGWLPGLSFVLSPSLPFDTDALTATWLFVPWRVVGWQLRLSFSGLSLAVVTPSRCKVGGSLSPSEVVGCPCVASSPYDISLPVHVATRPDDGLSVVGLRVFVHTGKR